MTKTISTAIILIGLLSPLSQAAGAAVSCVGSLSRQNLSHLIESEESFEQWLIWEQEANFEIFRKSRKPISVPVSIVPSDEVTTTFLPSASSSLRKFITANQNIRWFKHPYNEVTTLPYFNEPVVGTIPAFLSASRSLAVKINGEFYTLKMGTDRPHGAQGQLQTAKAGTAEDIQDGINRMRYIERVDSQIGMDPNLILAKEVAMVADKKSGDGYLFRDLSFMKSGNYYLPALSIPYVGREIAKHNGKSAEEFWQSTYAELLGVSKAKLLLRYGAQMETPNSQNMLIEFDRDMVPTGRLVFRDISDTILIEGVANGLGEHQVLAHDKLIGVENGKVLQPFWSNSAWRFDEAGDKSFKESTLKIWGKAHDAAYRNEIENALDVDLSQFQNIDKNPAFDQFMASDIIKKKLSLYRERLVALHQFNLRKLRTAGNQ